MSTNSSHVCKEWKAAMYCIWVQTEMKKNTFYNMAWEFYADMLKQTPECLTEEVQMGSQPSEAQKCLDKVMKAVRSTNAALTLSEAHAEIVVDQMVVPKVADGIWAGEAFGPNANNLWHQYGQDMWSESRLR